MLSLRQNKRHMFKRIDISRFNVKLKASIQSSGRLSFTEETVRVLNLSPDVYIGIGEDDEERQVLYLVILKEPDENSFVVNKAGRNHYLATKLMFDAMGIDYVNDTFIFDMVRMESLDEDGGGEVYKLVRKLK